MKDGKDGGRKKSQGYVREESRGEKRTWNTRTKTIFNFVSRVGVRVAEFIYFSYLCWLPWQSVLCISIYIYSAVTKVVVRIWDTNTKLMLPRCTCCRVSFYFCKLWVTRTIWRWSGSTLLKKEKSVGTPAGKTRWQRQVVVISAETMCSRQTEVFMQITPEPTAPGRLVAAKLFNSDGSQAVVRLQRRVGGTWINHMENKDYHDSCSDCNIIQPQQGFL